MLFTFRAKLGELKWLYVLQKQLLKNTQLKQMIWIGLALLTQGAQALGVERAQAAHGFGDGLGIGAHQVSPVGVWDAFG